MLPHLLFAYRCMAAPQVARPSKHLLQVLQINLWTGQQLVVAHKSMTLAGTLAWRCFILCIINWVWEVKEGDEVVQEVEEDAIRFIYSLRSIACGL